MNMIVNIEGRRVISLGAKREVVVREGVTPDLNLILKVSPFDSGISCPVQINPGGPSPFESQKEENF